MKIIALIIIVLLLACIGPMLLLWSVNSLSELGGAEFYIDHSIWSYFVALVFLIVMKSAKSST